MVCNSENSSFRSRPDRMGWVRISDIGWSLSTLGGGGVGEVGGNELKAVFLHNQLGFPGDFLSQL